MKKNKKVEEKESVIELELEMSSIKRDEQLPAFSPLSLLASPIQTLIILSLDDSR